MKSLLDLIKILYGPKALSQTIGTRTNVIRLPNNKIKKYLKQELNIEEASDAAVQNAYNEMKELVPEIPKMNDGERLIYEGNLRRTKNKLQSMGVIPPDKTAEIVSMGTKEPISKEGVEQLIEEAGQTNRPGTLMGDIESRINKLKAISKEQGMTTEDILGDFAKSQTSMINQQREGLVRSTARQILYSDIKSGKLKVSKETEDIVMGKASGDPINTFRNIYGEDALEQLDNLTPELGQLRTEMEAEKLARSKFEFTPKLNRPKESYTPEEMEKILKDEDPEKFAKGGSVESLGLDYLTGIERDYSGRSNFEKGSIPEEENEEPSEEYVKSREAGRFKYSFDVQGPDSKIKKSGLPGRTNPKDYSLGITYLSNPGSETAPEIRVGGSRRGAGIEIRKKFKDGGLGYLVGE